MAGYLTAVLITDEQADIAETLEVAGCALRGGVTAIVVRQPHAPAREVFELTRKLRPATRRLRCQLFVSDRLDVALAADADGVHLGVRSLPVAAARRVLPVGMKLGLSVHNLDEVGQAEEHGVDYVFAGPIFETRTHPGTTPLGLDAYREAVLRAGIGVCAIGGISAENVKSIAAAGGPGAAAISSFYSADDPAETARAFRAAFGT